MSNSNCYYTTCQWKCCNRNRDCPEDYNPSYYDSYYTQCYYYYSNSTGSSGGGAIAGYVIAGVVLIVIAVALIIHCKRKRDFENQQLANAANQGGGQTIIIDPSQQAYGGQPAYGQPMPPYGGTVYPPAQPVYGGQPYVQPAQYGYPQQQGPIIIQH